MRSIGKARVGDSGNGGIWEKHVQCSRGVAWKIDYRGGYCELQNRCRKVGIDLKGQSNEIFDPLFFL
jgi:hypothetical protein